MVVDVLVEVAVAVEFCFAISPRMYVFSSFARLRFVQSHGSDGLTSCFVRALKSWIVCVDGSLGVSVDLSSGEGFESRVSVIHRPETVTAVGGSEGRRRARFFTPQIALQSSGRGSEWSVKSVFDGWGRWESTSGWNEDVENVVGIMMGMKRFEIGEAVVGDGNWRVMRVMRMRALEI